MKDPETEFASVVAGLRNKLGVTPPSDGEGTRRKFGSNGLRINGKVFAMLSAEKRLIVKLPRERVDALVDAGDGERFDPRRNGRVMREWIVMKTSSITDWLKLAREALDFVGNSG
ncbi:MAG TPA: hypothetical protein VNA15_12935 [Candidatus Angelobacter sp.]|nr:hypothetical protein [Candidatus Angelobacter sp.]